MRYPRSTRYDRLRPGDDASEPYQTAFWRRTGDEYEAITWVGVPGIRVYYLGGTVNSSRTLMQIPSAVPVAPFEGTFVMLLFRDEFLAVCAAYYDTVVEIFRSCNPSTVCQTSCRFSPGEAG